MSRWSDADPFDEFEERPNADCSDCGEGFIRAAIDTRTLCDACCDQRDLWTSALELTMAAADLRSDVVDVAVVPVDPAAPLTAVLNVRLEPARAAAAVGLSVDPPVVHQRATIFDRLPTLSAVQNSRAYKPIPKAKDLKATQKRRSA